MQEELILISKHFLGRDKLPWSLNMLGFSAYSLQGSGNHVKLQILKPVNTTATLAITPKYQVSLIF